MSSRSLRGKGAAAADSSSPSPFRKQKESPIDVVDAILAAYTEDGSPVASASSPPSPTSLNSPQKEQQAQPQQRRDNNNNTNANAIPRRHSASSSRPSSPRPSSLNPSSLTAVNSASGYQQQQKRRSSQKDEAAERSLRQSSSFSVGGKRDGTSSSSQPPAASSLSSARASNPLSPPPATANLTTTTSTASFEGGGGGGGGDPFSSLHFGSGPIDVGTAVRQAREERIARDNLVMLGLGDLAADLGTPTTASAFKSYNQNINNNNNKSNSFDRDTRRESLVRGGGGGVTTGVNSRPASPSPREPSLLLSPTTATTAAAATTSAAMLASNSSNSHHSNITRPPPSQHHNLARALRTADEKVVIPGLDSNSSNNFNFNKNNAAVLAATTTAPFPLLAPTPSSANSFDGGGVGFSVGGFGGHTTPTTQMLIPLIPPSSSAAVAGVIAGPKSISIGTARSASSGGGGGGLLMPMMGGVVAPTPPANLSASQHHNSSSGLIMRTATAPAMGGSGGDSGLIHTNNNNEASKLSSVTPTAAAAAVSFIQNDDDDDHDDDLDYAHSSSSPNERLRRHSSSDHHHHHHSHRLKRSMSGNGSSKRISRSNSSIGRNNNNYSRHSDQGREQRRRSGRRDNDHDDSDYSDQEGASADDRDDEKDFKAFGGNSTFDSSKRLPTPVVRLPRRRSIAAPFENGSENESNANGNKNEGNGNGGRNHVRSNENDDFQQEGSEKENHDDFQRLKKKRSMRKGGFSRSGSRKKDRDADKEEDNGVKGGGADERRPLNDATNINNVNNNNNTSTATGTSSFAIPPLNGFFGNNNNNPMMNNNAADNLSFLSIASQQQQKQNAAQQQRAPSLLQHSQFGGLASSLGRAGSTLSGGVGGNNNNNFTTKNDDLRTIIAQQQRMHFSATDMLDMNRQQIDSLQIPIQYKVGGYAPLHRTVQMILSALTILTGDCKQNSTEVSKLDAKLSSEMFRASHQATHLKKTLEDYAQVSAMEEMERRLSLKIDVLAERMSVSTTSLQSTTDFLTKRLDATVNDLISLKARVDSINARSKEQISVNDQSQREILMKNKDELTALVNKCTSDLSQLKTAVAAHATEFKSNIVNHKETMAAMKETIDSNTRQNLSHAENFDIMNAELSKKFTAMDEEMRNLHSNLTRLSSSHESVTVEIENDLQQLQKDHIAAVSRIDQNAQHANGAINAQLSSLKEDLLFLQNELSGVKNDAHARIQHEASVAAANINTVENNLQQLNDKLTAIASLQTETTNHIDNSFTAFETSVRTYTKSKIAALGDTVCELVTELQKQQFELRNHNEKRLIAVGKCVAGLGHLVAPMCPLPVLASLANVSDNVIIDAKGRRIDAVTGAVLSYGSDDINQGEETEDEPTEEMDGINHNSNRDDGYYAAQEEDAKAALVQNATNDNETAKDKTGKDSGNRNGGSDSSPTTTAKTSASASASGALPKTYKGVPAATASTTVQKALDLISQEICYANTPIAPIVNVGGNRQNKQRQANNATTSNVTSPTTPSAAAGAKSNGNINNNNVSSSSAAAATTPTLSQCLKAIRSDVNFVSTCAVSGRGTVAVKDGEAMKSMMLLTATSAGLVGDGGNGAQQRSGGNNAANSRGGQVLAELMALIASTADDDDDEDGDNTDYFGARKNNQGEPSSDNNNDDESNLLSNKHRHAAAHLIGNKRPEGNKNVLFFKRPSSSGEANSGTPVPASLQEIVRYKLFNWIESNLWRRKSLIMINMKSGAVSNVNNNRSDVNGNRTFDRASSSSTTTTATARSLIQPPSADGSGHEGLRTRVTFHLNLKTQHIEKNMTKALTTLEEDRTSQISKELRVIAQQQEQKTLSAVKEAIVSEQQQHLEILQRQQRELLAAAGGGGHSPRRHNQNNAVSFRDYHPPTPPPSSKNNSSNQQQHDVDATAAAAAAAAELRAAEEASYRRRVRAEEEERHAAMMKLMNSAGVVPYLEGVINGTNVSGIGNYNVDDNDNLLHANGSSGDARDRSPYRRTSLGGGNGNNGGMAPLLLHLSRRAGGREGGTLISLLGMEVVEGGGPNNMNFSSGAADNPSFLGAYGKQLVGHDPMTMMMNSSHLISPPADHSALLMLGGNQNNSNSSNVIITSGVFISKIIKDGPSFRAGLVEGDRIVAVNHHEVTDSIQSLIDAVGSLPILEHSPYLRVIVRRGGAMDGPLHSVRVEIEK